MDFRAQHLQAMRGQAPALFKRLTKNGQLENQAALKSKEAERMFRGLTKDGPKGKSGQPTLQARREAEEQLRASLVRSLQDETILPENNNLLNRAAHKWLLEARAPAPADSLHLLTLAFWGLENAVKGEWPERDRPALEEQVGLLLGWKPENVLRWLLGNPNGGPRAEQAQDLLKLLHSTDSPSGAAANVLNAIYSRQVADNTAL